MIGELISGGISLLGGLFGSKKKQTTTSTVDYKKMVKDSSAAGFNPLTAIRNGGSAGFTTTTSPTISNTSEILGNLGGILGEALENKLDPIQAKKRELDTALVDQQLRALKQGPQLDGGFQQPRYYSGVKVSQQAVPRLGASSTKKVASVTPSLPQGFPGPRPVKGAGKDGEILPATVAWERSDGSLMYTYNPEFPDGDAALAGAAVDGAGRAIDEFEDWKFGRNDYRPGAPRTRVNNSTGKYQRKPPLYSAPSGTGRWGRYGR
ncbi:hypothetical protein [Flyfo microvirus Tbat2_43]|nr:hypothetical protein [Flyfo microvirus Tbat2_43]